MVQQAYELGKQVHQGSMTQQSAVQQLTDSGMNRVSAQFYVECYRHMIRGNRYTRQTNVYSTNYYLNRVFMENGSAGLSKALRALSLHLDYYEEVSGNAVHEKRTLLAKYRDLLGIRDVVVYPDDVEASQELKEGNTKSVSVNIYERNPEARNECIAHYGAQCSVCDFSFEARYGDMGKGFIHVHHLRELSSIGKEYSVNPITDLIPVCPNCHAMLHKRKPAYTITELRKLLRPFSRVSD